MVYKLSDIMLTVTCYNDQITSDVHIICNIFYLFVKRYALSRWSFGLNSAYDGMDTPLYKIV